MASIEDARLNTLEGLMSGFQMNFRDAESYYSRSLRSDPGDGTTRSLLDAVSQRIRARALMGVVD